MSRPRPPRRSKSRDRVQRTEPLRSIALTIKLDGPRRGQLGRLAAEKGLTLKEGKDGTSLTFTASTAEEALEALRVLAGLVGPKS